MSRKLQKNLVVLGIGSAAAVAIGVASAHDRATGQPVRQAVQPAQSDPTARRGESLGMGGAGRGGTGGASDAGTRRRGKGKKGGDGGMMTNGDGGTMREGMGDGGMMRGRGGRGGRDGGGGGGGGGGDRDAG